MALFCRFPPPFERFGTVHPVTLGTKHVLGLGITIFRRRLESRGLVRLPLGFNCRSFCLGMIPQLEVRREKGKRDCCRSNPPCVRLEFYLQASSACFKDANGFVFTPVEGRDLKSGLDCRVAYEK